MSEFPHYEPVLSSQATAFLVAQTRQQQQRLVMLLHQLANNPFQPGDYSVPDDTGREVNFLLVGEYLIGFWADHAVKEFRIVEINK